MILKLSLFALENDENFKELLQGYADESSIKGMPKFNAQMETYRKLEELGMYEVLGAFDDGQLVGILCTSTVTLPHYGAKVASTESFYVFPDYRSRGHGLKLLWEAERRAAEAGAVGFFVSAPKLSRLSYVMEGMDKYRETNRVFFKALANG